MNIQITGNKLITKMLNDWYQNIRAQRVSEANKLKEEIDKKLHIIEGDINVLFHYYLLDFRYKVLIDGIGISKNSFDKLDSLPKPNGKFLEYYYYFFKSIHSTILSNYSEASNYFDKAERLLKNIPDEVEQAEFNYRVSTLKYQMYQAYSAIEYASKARDIFAKHAGHEMNVALCENVLGLSFSKLKQHERAEEYIVSALNTLQKNDAETLVLRIRHNLGLLYASQNLSVLAIRHLSEVSKKMPNHYKAIFIEAGEYYKIGEIEKAKELIEIGLEVCKELKNDEYRYHFLILNEFCRCLKAENVEKIMLESFSYFERENLNEYICEYAEKLAIEFHKEGNIEKAEKYFYKAYETRKRIFDKGALK
ncbi:tetratricopeptide repeat protein [Bacillus sp. SBS7]|uniref:response regulator aspartate phosphatase n=1 Tax=Bacillus sp. SBS7 TaxID=3401756 RepID=UPI003AA88064